MLKKDCQLMGLTWLLARNKTAYIPTVSAVFRAIMYSAHPHQSKCSPDQENMPLAVDSLQFYKLTSPASSPPSVYYPFFIFLFLFLLSHSIHMLWYDPIAIYCSRYLHLPLFLFFVWFLCLTFSLYLLFCLSCQSHVKLYLCTSADLQGPFLSF